MGNYDLMVGPHFTHFFMENLEFWSGLCRPSKFERAARVILGRDELHLDEERLEFYAKFAYLPEDVHGEKVSPSELNTDSFIDMICQTTVGKTFEWYK